MKELNVIGTMQLLAACQQAPDVRKLVLKSSAAVYGASNRDPAMFTEGMNAKRLATQRLRQGHHRGRVLHARLRPPPSRRRRHHAADRQRHRPPDHLGDDRLLPAAGDPDRARLQPAAAVPPRAGRARRARARHRQRRHRHLQRRRRRRHHARARPYAASAGPSLPLPGFAVPTFGSAIRQTRRRRLLAGAGGLPDLRPRPGHHPDALDARLRAELHHRRGLRRLRGLARARVSSAPSACGRPSPPSSAP